MLSILKRSIFVLVLLAAAGPLVGCASSGANVSETSTEQGQLGPNYEKVLAYRAAIQEAINLCADFGGGGHSDFSAMTRMLGEIDDPVILLNWLHDLKDCKLVAIGGSGPKTWQPSTSAPDVTTTGEGA